MEIELFGHDLALDERRIDAPDDELLTRLRAYERGDRLDIGLPVRLPDSFTGTVLRELRTIPPGETRSYARIAESVGSAPIAVGSACGRNPVPLVVPCHRVVRSDGGLGGYSAAGGVELKRRLLEHERARVP